MATKKKKTEKPKQPDDIKREPFRQNLPVVLKREELEERAQRAAHLLQDHDAMQHEHKEQARSNKLELDKVASNLRDVSRTVREGKEYRDVQCERVFNWTRGTVTDLRKDTGEVLSERAMTEAEAQKALPFDDKPGDVDEEFGAGEKTDDSPPASGEGENEATEDGENAAE